MKKKIVWLTVLSYLVSVLPLLVFFLCRAKTYVTCVSDTVKLSCGGAILLFLCLLKVLGKLRLERRTIFFAVSLVLSYLLERVLCDLSVIFLIALLSEFCDYFVCVFLNREKEKVKEETVSKNIQNAIGEYIRGAYGKE